MTGNEYIIITIKDGDKEMTTRYSMANADYADAAKGQCHKCSYPEKKTMRHYWLKWRGELWCWIYLYIWCRYCHRRIMKLAHRFNWHYMERTPALDESSTSPDKGLLGYMTYRKRHLRCSWCGVSGYVLKADHEK